MAADDLEHRRESIAAGEAFVYGIVIALGDGMAVRTPSPPGDDFLGVMRQDWRDLLFLHWQVDAAALARLLPAPLHLDTHHGTAWVGLVPFAVERLRPRGLPPVPGVSHFPEINVRTYVRFRGVERGVWLFSLDAGSALAARAARLAYHLPYFGATSTIERRGGEVSFSSRRDDGPGHCRVIWRPRSETPAAAQPGSLGEFLIERYALFAVRGERVYRARVSHQPYPLVGAEVALLEEDLMARAGIGIEGPPVRVHAAGGVDVKVSPPERVLG